MRGEDDAGPCSVQLLRWNSVRSVRCRFLIEEPLNIETSDLKF
jgi:hypothetical protein